MSWRNAKIAYWPYHPSLSVPGDRRRFVFFANDQKIDFEIASTDKEYDIVYLTSNCNTAKWIEYKKKHPKTKIVFELIDSYVLEKSNVSNILRGTVKYLKKENSKLYLNYKKAFYDIITTADAVVCSTPIQKNHMLKWNKNIHISLDYFENEITNKKTTYNTGEKIKLVWEGQAYTVQNILEIDPILEQLKDRIELHIITDPTIKNPIKKLNKETTQLLKKLSCKWEFHEWELQTFSELITNADAAIIPIGSSEIMWNKPENKLLLLWQMGMPVFTTATPAYKRVMKNSNVNMHCDTLKDWHNKLSSFISSNEQERISANLKAQEYLAKNHSKDLIVSRWQRIFESLYV